MSVSVVVVSNQPGDILARCVDSVLQQADEVIVVDNGSARGTAAAVAARVGARFLRLPWSTAFAVAANRAASEARCDVLAFLSEHAVAGERWLQSSLALLEDPTVGAVSPRLVLAGRYLEVDLDGVNAGAVARPVGLRLVTATLGGLDVLPRLVGAGVSVLETGPGGECWRWASCRAPFYAPLLDAGDVLDLVLNGDTIRPARVVDLLSSAGSYLGPDGTVGGIGSEAPDDGRLEVAEERFSLSGAALVTRRDVWGRVGGFPPRYLAYYEDTDWCWRARLMGFRMFCEPAATVRLEQVGSHFGLRRQRHLRERNRILTLARNAPLELALSEAWRKRRAAAEDGVSELLPTMLPRALAERQILRRRWVMRPREIFERWAGLDVPVA